MPPWLATRMATLGRVLVEALVHPLRPRRAVAPARASVLVPVARLRHGHGLAQLGDHDERARRAQARARPRRARARACTCAAAAASHSRKTPDELRALGERVGFDGDALAHTSKLVAKVDSAAVQDGYQLYLHGFVVADDGKWVVVQQGMRPEARHGAPLSLALGGRAQLRRRAARGDRRRSAHGRYRQPDGSARGDFAYERSSSWSRAGPTRCCRI